MFWLRAADCTKRTFCDTVFFAVKLLLTLFHYFVISFHGPNN